MFSKSKTVLPEIHLLLTSDKENGNVFEVSIIGFERANSSRNILLKAKVATLEKKKAVADHVQVLGEFCIKIKFCAIFKKEALFDC